MLSATDAMDAAEAHVDGQNERRARESHDQLVAASQGSGLAAVRCALATTQLLYDYYCTARIAALTRVGTRSSTTSKTALMPFPLPFPF